MVESEEVWLEHYTADGKVYYSHPHTHKTLWERPAGARIISPHSSIGECFIALVTTTMHELFACVNNGHCARNRANKISVFYLLWPRAELLIMRHTVRQNWPHKTAWQCLCSICITDSAVGPEKLRQKAMAKSIQLSHSHAGIAVTPSCG